MARGELHLLWQHSSVLYKLWPSWGMTVCGPVLAAGQGQLRSNLEPELVGGGGWRREMCNTSITGTDWGPASDPRVNKLVWASPSRDLQLRGFISKGLSKAPRGQGQQAHAWPLPQKRRQGLVTSTLEEFVFLPSSLISIIISFTFHPIFQILSFPRQHNYKRETISDEAT